MHFSASNTSSKAKLRISIAYEGRKCGFKLWKEEENATSIPVPQTNQMVDYYILQSIIWNWIKKTAH